MCFKCKESSEPRTVVTKRLVEISFSFKWFYISSSTDRQSASGDDAAGWREQTNGPDDGWTERELFRVCASVSAIPEM